MYIANHELAVQGTFAWFQKVLALQHQIFVADRIYGNDFTNIEIDMNLISITYMKGALVFTTNNGLKSCISEMRRIAGLLITIILCITYNKCSKIFNTSCLTKRHRQTAPIQIRQLLKQSDLGLSCLLF